MSDYMHDTDTALFDPDQWTLTWRREKTAPNTWVRTRVLTALNGTRFVARQEDLAGVLRSSRPIWMMETGTRQFGWIVRSRQNDPIFDLNRALHLGYKLSSHLRPIETYLLDQGLMGGRWRCWKQSNGLSFCDMKRALPVPDELLPLISSLNEVSRFSKEHGAYYLRSGTDIIDITLPSSRHGVMARRAQLRADAPKSQYAA